MTTVANDAANIGTWFMDVKNKWYASKKKILNTTLFETVI